jgi:hypothetical protein
MVLAIIVEIINLCFEIRFLDIIILFFVLMIITRSSIILSIWRARARRVCLNLRQFIIELVRVNHDMLIQFI